MKNFPWEKDPAVKTEREGLAFCMDHRGGAIHHAETPEKAVTKAALSDQARGQGHRYMVAA